MELEALLYVIPIGTLSTLLFAIASFVFCIVILVRCDTITHKLGDMQFQLGLNDCHIAIEAQMAYFQRTSAVHIENFIQNHAVEMDESTQTYLSYYLALLIVHSNFTEYSHENIFYKDHVG